MFGETQETTSAKGSYAWINAHAPNSLILLPSNTHSHTQMEYLESPHTSTAETPPLPLPLASPFHLCCAVSVSASLAVAEAGQAANAAS